jgi:hypothetical protein
MVTLPGATESNMSPPTVCMLALAAWQVALVMLARGPMTRWLARRRPWTAVVAAGSVTMTVYLWQMTALVALLGVVVAAGLPLPTPGSAAWWLSRPLWLAALAVLLTPLVLAFARWERPAGPSRRQPAAPPARRPAVLAAAILGLVYATFGLFGLVVGGFAPVPDRAGSALLALRVDPLQSAACLAFGALLLRAARSGAAAAPAFWRLAALGFAALLAPTLPGIAGTAAQLIAIAPANQALHGAALAIAIGFAVRRPRRVRETAPEPVPWSRPEQARPQACPPRTREEPRGQVA